ncbi:hypothetical protein B0T24DRAFT_685241 [Lasiosphaeria ovina]|uniref:Uncharacterized protein n=1 Tax=Lasiosphaeria ovina TaxID=92902 RepID=A0AAE0MYB8_9PEZI|nr:hypothetical protein B0T24DRAFT_685241 [Lasiosphaeria ovina]
MEFLLHQQFPDDVFTKAAFWGQLPVFQAVLAGETQDDYNYLAQQIKHGALDEYFPHPRTKANKTVYVDDISDDDYCEDEPPAQAVGDAADDNTKDADDADFKKLNGMHQKVRTAGRTRLTMGAFPNEVLNTRAGLFSLWQFLRSQNREREKAV